MSSTYDDLTTESYDKGYGDGARAALEWISESYEGIEDTDAWAEYFGEAEKEEEV